MDDAELVRSARDGDSEAFAQIYDRYADRIHDFCASVLRDRDEAADATHDTFIQAWQKLGGLRDPDKLKPWLYAIARHESIRRGKILSRMAPSEKVDDMTAPQADPTDKWADDAVLQETVWAAAGSLSEDDRVLLDLQLRQDLKGAELAAAIGVSENHANVLSSRLRSKLETALGAMLIARLGRDECDELAELLHDWDGRFSSVTRKRVSRHVDKCEICSERRRKLSPAALYAATPVVAAPALLRSKVLDGIAGEPAAATTIEVDPVADWTPDKAGFPPPDVAKEGTRRGALVAGIAAATIALLALSVLVFFDEGTVSVEVVAPPTAEPTPSPTESATATPDPTEEPSTPTPEPSAASDPEEPAAPDRTLTTWGDPADRVNTPTPTPTETPSDEAASPAESPTSTPPPPPAPPTSPQNDASPAPSAAPTSNAAPAPAPTASAAPTVDPPPPAPQPVPPPPPPVDDIPPSVSGVSANPAMIWESVPALCVGQPQTTTVSATVTDNETVASVTLSWSVSGSSGSVPMSNGGGSTWTANLGPFGENTVDGEIGWTINLTVTATDGEGNEASAGGTATLRNCTLI